MADHNPQHGRRPHFNRGRRGPDRRGTERRTPPREHAPDTVHEPARDGGVDVEQVMREIRSRIAQRHGIELSTQQIQELAARRLEAILEPRNVKPQLLEQLRRSAAKTEVPASSPLETYEFEEHTLFETHRGIVRFFRTLLNPILKLLFNPTPLINALNTQARINKELTTRELEREQRQSEWNALQFELLQRMVLETSRVTIEMQALTAKVESLNAKVDFNERRVRSLETVPSATPPRPQPRHQEVMPAAPASTAEGSSPEPTTPAEGGEGTRRRRRRRRGRRSSGGLNEAPGPAGVSATGEDEIDAGDGNDVEEDDATAEVTAIERPADRPETTAVPAAPEEHPTPQSLTPAPPTISPVEPSSEPQPPTAPTPPRDEPVPQDPTDRADPGPVDR
jgi:hypothetical protein